MQVCFLKRDIPVPSRLQGKGLISSLSKLCGLELQGNARLVLRIFTQLLEVKQLPHHNGLVILPASEEAWNVFIAIINGAPGRLMSQTQHIHEINALCELFPAARHTLSSFATLAPAPGGEGIRYLVALHAVFSDRQLDARKLQTYLPTADAETERVFEAYSELLLAFELYPLLAKISESLPLLIMKCASCPAVSSMCPIVATGPALLQFLRGEATTEPLYVHMATESDAFNRWVHPADEAPVFPLSGVDGLILHLKTTESWEYGIGGFETLSWDDFYQTEQSQVLSKLSHKSSNSFGKILNSHSALMRWLGFLDSRLSRISTDMYERASGIQESLEEEFQNIAAGRGALSETLQRVLLASDPMQRVMLIGSTIYASPELVVALRTKKGFTKPSQVPQLAETIPELLLHLREQNVTMLRANFERFFQSALTCRDDAGVRLACPLHITFRSLARKGERWELNDPVELRNTQLVEVWLLEYRLRFLGAPQEYEPVFLVAGTSILVPPLITAKTACVCLIISGLDNSGKWCAYWLIPPTGMIEGS